MLLPLFEINAGMSASDIVLQNYRTADVFRKYDIEYCCTGRWPLETVCVMKGLDFVHLKKELEEAGHVIQLPSQLHFETWDVDFLIRYIINVHHSYLKKSLPDTMEILKLFAEGHVKKYPYMLQVLDFFEMLKEELMLHIKKEEETVFPYLFRLADVYERNAHTRLPVKMPHRPPEIVLYEQQVFPPLFMRIKTLTNGYIPPERACVNHIVVLSKLKELEASYAEYMHLENDILFEKILKIESTALR